MMYRFDFIVSDTHHADAEKICDDCLGAIFIGEHNVDHASISHLSTSVKEGSCYMLKLFVDIPSKKADKIKDVKIILPDDVDVAFYGKEKISRYKPRARIVVS